MVWALSEDAKLGSRWTLQQTHDIARLVAEGVIEPVAHAEWSTPLVASDKKTI